jgi:hypothetical protein
MQGACFFYPCKISARVVCLLLLVFKVTFTTLAQEADSTKKVLHFSGSISANNNGFSLVPTFSLGKPAIQTGFNISGKGRLSFHPQFWYSMLDYKPWSFIFIWRYQLIRKEKFQFLLGTHAPAINFKSATVLENGAVKDVVKARRFYPAVELSPVFQLKKDIFLSMYYLYGRGIEEEVSSNNNFLSLRADFNRIPLGKKYFLRFNPQLYYLRIDDKDGIYTAQSLTLAKDGSPFNFSTIINQSLKSNIAAKDFDWNVSLNYTFGQHFVAK